MNFRTKVRQQNFTCMLKCTLKRCHSILLFSDVFSYFIKCFFRSHNLVLKFWSCFPLFHRLRMKSRGKNIDVIWLVLLMSSLVYSCLSRSKDHFQFDTLFSNVFYCVSCMLWLKLYHIPPGINTWIPHNWCIII